MSEFNEELLNDVDDYPDLAEADEDALLQDDDDVLDLVPEEDIGESLDDSKQTVSEQEDEKEKREDKFAIERKRITAPEPSVEETITPRPNNRFQRPNNWGFQRGRGGNNANRNRFQNNGRGRMTYGDQSGRNKTVLINPRFQGVVHVNNNARLAWDTAQQQQFQQNPWVTGTPPGQMGGPIQPIPGTQTMAGPPMQAVQGVPPMQQQMHGFHVPPHMQPNYQGAIMQPIHQEIPMQQGPPMQPIQNMGPQGQQLHFTPPPQQQQLHFTPPPQQQQPYMPQPLPPGVQQAPMQTTPTTPYWDGQNQFSAVEQGPNQPINHYNDYQSSPPVMVRNSQSMPQVQTSSYQMFNQQAGMPPMQQQNFNPHPQNSVVFPSNNNMSNMQYPQSNMAGPDRRELFTQKRKVMTPGFSQNKKVFVQDRLGTAQQPQIRAKNFVAKSEERLSVVREVTVTNVTTVKIEEDEETRDLRLKIEEQKRKREAILQWKEKRRLENLIAQQRPAAFATDQKVITPLQQAVKVEKPQSQSTPIQKPIVQQVKQVVQPFKQVVQPVKQVVQPVRQVVQPVQQVVQPVQQVNQSGFANKIKKQGNNIVITNGFSRKQTKYQKSSKDVNRVVLTVPRTPIQKPIKPEPELQLDKKHLSSFLADRTILTKDESLMSTRKVVIKNISTSTGDKKLFQISKSIGEVQKLHRDKNERQATVTFKSVASAHAFFKKYQRHMLDLSMIEVSLCPMTESDE